MKLNIEFLKCSVRTWTCWLLEVCRHLSVMGNYWERDYRERDLPRENLWIWHCLLFKKYECEKCVSNLIKFLNLKSKRNKGSKFITHKKMPLCFAGEPDVGDVHEFYDFEDKIGAGAFGQVRRWKRLTTTRANRGRKKILKYGAPALCETDEDPENWDEVRELTEYYFSKTDEFV